MEIRGVFIEDTFAEAFGMRASRIVVTARNLKWARTAALKLTGFATSVIACKCEAAIERELGEAETPDGRPGVSVLFFTMDSDSLGKRLIERIGQTVLTCPTTSCFDGLPDSPDRLSSGRAMFNVRPTPATACAAQCNCRRASASARGSIEPVRFQLIV